MLLTLLRHCGRDLLTFRTVAAVNKSYYTTEMGKRVAVVLAGCGVYDGSEIHEASAILVHLSRGGASVSLLVCCMYEPVEDILHGPLKTVTCVLINGVKPVQDHNFTFHQVLDQYSLTSMTHALSTVLILTILVV